MSLGRNLLQWRKRRCFRELGAYSALAAMLTILGGVPAWAADETADVGRTPPRLSFTAGNVSFWRPGTEDWVAARLNMALAPGDMLYTGSGAQAELQIGSRAFVRLGDDTQLAIANQEPDFVQLKINSGRATLDLRELERGHTVQIDTPNAAVTVEEPGYYRFDVNQDATTLVTRRGGRARARANGVQTTDVGPNDRLVIEGTDAPRVAVYTAPALDEWDRWNYERTDRLLAAESSRYLPRDVYGAEALDEYGTWRVEPTYGRVWVPGYVSPDWAPYSTGQWMSDTSYGWTWVDDAPWGWAPYHYGRWVHLNNYWGWAPGPIVGRPVYAPALVAFFGGPGFRVGIGVPFVSWVALGWGEPLVPWWGARGFIGVPCWRGWGGPRVVNNVFVNNTTIVNVHQPTTFVNTRVHDAVVTVPRDGFGGRPVERVRNATLSPHDLRPLRGELPIKPASVAGRQTPPERPRGVGTTAPSGREATRSTTGGRQPDTNTTLTERRIAPRDTRGGTDDRRPSSAGLQEAPRVAPQRDTQRPSFGDTGTARATAAATNPSARRADGDERVRAATAVRTSRGPATGPPQAPPPPRRPLTRAARGRQMFAPPPPRQAAPPLRQAERERPQGSFSAPQRPYDAPPPPRQAAPPLRQAERERPQGSFSAPPAAIRRTAAARRRTATAGPATTGTHGSRRTTAVVRRTR